jgi:hypothetical protein
MRQRKLTNLTPESVKTAIERLVKMHKGKVVQKKSSKLMGLIAKFIPWFTPIKEDEFLEEYTQTLPGHIYVAFKLGDTSTGYSLETQLRVMVHECGHLDQFNADPKMPAKYLGRPAIRAMLEAECFSMNAEFNYFCRGVNFSDRVYSAYASKLKNYGCDADDIKGAYATIEAHCEMTKMAGEPHLDPIINMIKILEDLNMLK